MKRTTVYVFVDWNSQVHERRGPRGMAEPTAIEVLEHVVKKLCQILKPFEATNRFEVHLRLYHGWHRGYEPTPRRRELARVTDEELFSLSGLRWLVVRSLEFGDRSLNALDRRIVASTGSHFPATVRPRGQSEAEKMVDTALVADLIFSAHQDLEESWLIVVGEDIDLMPGIYSAEAFLQGTGRRIAYLRNSADRYLNCNDLRTMV